MNSLRHIIVAATFSAISGFSAAAHAEDATAPLTMKPNHGISFDIGSKRAVSYFLREAGTCKLALVMSAAFDGIEVPTDTPTRLEVAIEAGRSARVDAEAGRSLEFACQASAQGMTVSPVSQVAYTAR